MFQSPLCACVSLMSVARRFCVTAFVTALTTLGFTTFTLGAEAAEDAEPGRTGSPTPASGANWVLYLEPFYGTAIIDQISGTGIGTGEIINGTIDGRLREGRLDDGVAGLGLRLERDINNWHLGLALSWRYRTDWDLTARTPSIQSITNVFSDIETRSATLQVGRHWQRGKHRFAVDAGLGLVRNRIESEYLEREVPGVRPQLRFEAKRTPRDLAWNVTLSWHKDLGPRWRFGTRYRYSNLGDLATGDFELRDADLAARHRSHDVVVSFGRRF